MRHAWIALAACHITSMTATPVGQIDAAPPFALAAQDGKTVALGHEPTVLVFYRGYW